MSDKVKADKAEFVAAFEYGDVENTWWNFVEYQRRLYTITWTGTLTVRPGTMDFEMKLPDLKHFPKVEEGVGVELTAISTEMQSLLATTDHVMYGADFCIRSPIGTIDEVVKIALPKKGARARLQSEWAMLFLMSKLQLPVPRVRGEPYADKDGVFAFRMERLKEWSGTDKDQRKKDICRLKDLFHEHGICHNDLHRSNIMKREDGEAVLIDFGWTGLLGTTIPDHQQRYDMSSTFDFTIDETYVSNPNLFP